MTETNYVVVDSTKITDELGKAGSAINDFEDGKINNEEMIEKIDESFREINAHLHSIDTPFTLNYNKETGRIEFIKS